MIICDLRVNARSLRIGWALHRLLHAHSAVWAGANRLAPPSSGRLANQRPRLRLHRGHFVKNPIAQLMEKIRATTTNIHTLSTVLVEVGRYRKLPANIPIAQSSERP
jgi:hypothetical protein